MFIYLKLKGYFTCNVIITVFQHFKIFINNGNSADCNSELLNIDFLLYENFILRI